MPELSLEDVLREEFKALHRTASVSPNGGLQEVFRAIHRVPQGRSALCLSGGGIRSATFSLGVLQGLAERHLLERFDYLSTVSGGGYIGGWLAAWLRRAGSTTPPPAPDAVSDQLGSGPEGPFRADPAPVEHLRAYSNFLTPKLGATSADTWTLIAIFLRNLLLNWVLLLPLIAAVLLVPHFLLSIMALPAPRIAAVALIVTAFALGVKAVRYVDSDLPSADNKRQSQGTFLWNFLAPQGAAATLITIALAWWPALIGPGPLAVFGAVLALAGAGWGREPRPGIRDALKLSLAGGLAGLVLGSLLPMYPSKLFALATLPVLLLAYLFATTLTVGFTSETTTDDDREWWARSSAWTLIIAVAWIGLAAVALYGPDVVMRWQALGKTAFVAVGGISGLVTMVIGAGAKTAANRGSAGTASDTKRAATGAGSENGAGLRALALALAAPTFIVFVLAVLATADYVAMQALAGALARVLPESVAAVLAVALLAPGLASVGLYAGKYVNVNRFSLHAMYRNRLIRAYLGASNPERAPNPFTGFDPEDNVRMKDLAAVRPLPVINIALNLVRGTRLAWQRRKAASFTVSPLHCGSRDVGYRPTQRYGGPDGISLGTAVAISGAAASPNSGYHSSPVITFLLTLLNVRLGWWLGNPGRAGEEVWMRNGPATAVRPIIDELLGLTTDENPYVYLSDGGHFENLGLYEMVLRRCRFILAIDAGCDPVPSVFDDLGGAIRKIRIDLGIPIAMDGDADHPGEVLGGLHCRVATIDYKAVDGPHATEGKLVYVKAALTGDEPLDVVNYKWTRPLFPHESTVDQFFDEDQFESYRALGRHALDSMCNKGQWELAQFFDQVDEYARRA